MSTQLHGSIYGSMSSALNFCYVFHCNLKENDHIRRKWKVKKKCLHLKLVLFWFVQN